MFRRLISSPSHFCINYFIIKFQCYHIFQELRDEYGNLKTYMKVDTEWGFPSNQNNIRDGK